MEKTNYKSVKWLLLSLNLCDYTRVCIREHSPHGIIYVGGGYPGKVMQRFGSRLVTDSCIYEDALILYVLPDAEQQLMQLSDHWGDWCDWGHKMCACAGGRCCDCKHPFTVVDMVCPLDRAEPIKHQCEMYKEIYYFGRY